MSKHDVVRTALRLFLRLEEERSHGSRLLIERGSGGEQRELVEVWIL
jgi:Arc/MetJ-type ribon-helix-helix transcriptional regulator